MAISTGRKAKYKKIEQNQKQKCEKICIPNNNDNQDIVSMGTNSALMAKTVIENAYQVMAILMMGIVQAIDCLDIADRISPRSQQVYKEIRAFFPVFREDTPKYKEIEMMIDYLKKEDK